MSLASDIIAPAAVSPLMAAPVPAAAAAPVQVAAGAGFADALTQAQTVVQAGGAPEVALPDATVLSVDVAAVIGGDAVVSHRQSFVPVHGLAEFPAAAIDPRALQAAPVVAAVLAETEVLAVPAETMAAEAVVVDTVAAKPVPVPKPAVRSATAKPAEPADEPTEAVPAELALSGGAVAAPVVLAQPLPVASGKDDSAPVAVATRTTGAEPVTQEAALPAAAQAALAPFDASLTAAVADAPAPPTGDLRAALAGLQPIQAPVVAADEVPQPLAPTAPDAAQTDVALMPDLAAEAAGTMVIAPETAVAVAETAPQSQAAAPALPAPAALADAAAQVSAPVHPTLRMDQPDWPEKLAIRLAGAFDANEANIEMQLSPEHLGPLHIRLEMKSGMAQVFVTTATPQVAEAFARAEGQLSGLLAASEVTLTGQETAQGGFADQGGQGGYHGFHGQPAARFPHTDTSRSTAPKTGPSQLLNLIA